MHQLQHALRQQRNPKILDVASGPGEPALSIAAAMPHAGVLSTDLSKEMLRVATHKAHERHLKNISFEAQDAEILDALFPSSFVSTRPADPCCCLLLLNRHLPARRTP